MQQERPLILNVDDTEAGRYAKTRILRHAGYRVIETGRGMEALELVARERPALVLLDVKLPDIDGLEVCARIKRQWPDTLVLQISASMVSGGDRARGLDSGADSYLVQPVEAAELLAAVRALLRLRAAEVALHDTLQRQNEVLELRLAEQKLELDRQTADREHAETALRQAQKMEAVGQLTGGIAHDFNNLLTAILGHLDLARRRSGGDETLTRCLEGATEAAERAGSLTQRLLAFSRRQPLAPRAVDVNALILGLSQMISRSLGEQIRLELDLGEGAPSAWCDPNQLENAILNLSINARDAMPGGGTLILSTGSRHVEASEVRTGAGMRPGDFAVITVADTGMGMSEQVMAQAFEPFFTTKPIGQGTGLGLSQVYGFTRQSRGWAEIQSEQGVGTRVSLVLPRAGAGEAGTVPRRTSEPVALAGAGETVLLVEDEPLVRAVVVNALEEQGYLVTQAEGAAEALEMLEQRGSFDLMLTDVGLPVLNGRQLAEMARQQSPGLKVLFMTGYAGRAGLDGEALAEQTDLIVKPFSIEALLGKVRTLLDAA